MSSVISSLVRLWFLLAALASQILSASALSCAVPASGTNTTDDAPAIIQAFEDCGQGGTITFSPETTYYVNTVMNVTAQDTVIDIQGSLVVSSAVKPKTLSYSFGG